jgi:photosystem II stability/assembly factor-like uncharacterized protein
MFGFASVSLLTRPLVQHLTTCIGGALAVGAAILLLPAARVHAQSEPADWEMTGLTAPSTHLFTPASGAFLAMTDAGLARSDDAGATWYSVPLPPSYSGQVVVDPNDQDRIYAGAWVTRDAGATWVPLGSWANDPGAWVWPTPAAADPNLLYLGIRTGEPGTGHVSLARSRNAGASWETVLNLGPGDFRPGAGIAFTLLATHPADPNLLFHSVTGFRGHGNQGTLRRSADQGQTFERVLPGVGRYATSMVGGRGAAPGRLYVGMTSEDMSSAVLASDDAGLTWRQVATFDPGPTGSSIKALACDPSAPDRVWAAVDPGGVEASDDGGQTWSTISPPDWTVSDVALGIDRANLYAATSSGVFRLTLK